MLLKSVVTRLLSFPTKLSLSEDSPTLFMLVVLFVLLPETEAALLLPLPLSADDLTLEVLALRVSSLLSLEFPAVAWSLLL